MPRIQLANTRASFGDVLLHALRYPLRGTALVTALVLALVYEAANFGMVFSVGARIVFWVFIWRYAAKCMVHAANGYAEPPHTGEEEMTGTGIKLAVLHTFFLLACAALQLWAVHSWWLYALPFVLVLPAIDMSMAFDGGLSLAFHPGNWIRIAGRFGAMYAVPVLVNLLTLLMAVSVANALRDTAGTVLGYPLYGFACSYLVIFNLQLMGALVYRQHDAFGIDPEAPRLARLTNQDGDEQLLAAVERLRPSDIEAAQALLVERLHHRAAPASMHRAYRDILRERGARDALLIHGQIWSAALVANNDVPRALGLVQECIDLDPAFMPDDPTTLAPLIDRAARTGMSQLALQLGRGFVLQWPRAEQAPRFALLVAELLGRQPARRAEAAIWLAKSLDTWPDDPLREQMLALQRQLGVAAHT